MKKNSKLYILFFSILAIVFLIAFYFFQSHFMNYSSIKIDSNEYLVYTKYSYEKDGFSITLPYINIIGEDSKAINDSIDMFYSHYSSNPYCNITYEYSIQGNILSVLLKAFDYQGTIPDITFQSYQFHLKRLSLISDDELLSMFSITKDDVKNAILNKFQYFYEQILSEGYYTEEECSYSCFMEYRGVSSYLDNVSYYVRDGTLFAYKPFIFSSIFGEEDFFKEEDFQFLIVDIKKD